MRRSPQRHGWLALARWFLLASVVIALVDCGQAEDPGSSESHFLQSCSGECRAGFSCLCGVCTETCEIGSRCSELGPGAECLLDFASELCAGAAEPGSIGPACDVECTADADCGPLGGDAMCLRSRCRYATSCEAEAERARRTLSAALENADRDCSVAADCVAVATDTGCVRGCPVAAASAGAEAVEAAVAATEAACVAYGELGCEGPSAPACAEGPNDPICLEGRCQLAAVSLAGCVESVESAVSGGPCGSDCSLYDGCCYQGVFCTNETAQLVSPDWTCDAGLVTSCESAPNASLAGTTPLGPVNLAYGWGSYSFAFAVYAYVFFTDSSPAATCGAVRLGAYLTPGSDGYSGVHVVPVTVYAGGARAVALGRFEISATGETGSPMIGELTVDEAGWDLSGSFTLSACPDLDRSGS